MLPSINGTNTTTSHGGLLEVEKTFKSVDQSRKEYEMERQTLPTILRKRPIRNTVGNQPSSSAVLAAVGAGQSLLFYKTNFLSKYLETLENLTFELTHEIKFILMQIDIIPAFWAH